MLNYANFQRHVMPFSDSDTIRKNEDAYPCCYQVNLKLFL